MNTNQKMNELYGVNPAGVCKECKHFDEKTKKCAVAGTKVMRFWIGCGKWRLNK